MTPAQSAGVSEEVNLFGGFFRHAREEQGISVRELARRTGLSANAISMIERDLVSPTLATAGRITSVLGLRLVVTKE